MLGDAAQQPQYQAAYRACIKEAAVHGAALMQATLARAQETLPGMAMSMEDVVERNLLLDAVLVLRDHQQTLAQAFPQALLAEFAQAIAGDRASVLGFESLPLLADEQLQENMDLVRAAQALQQAVQPQLADLESLLAAAQLSPPQGGQLRHPLRPEVYVRAVYRLTRQSPVSPAVRRRWLRHLPAAMAPELAQAYRVWAGTLRAQGLGPAHIPAAPAPAAVPEGADRTTQLTIRELRKLLASGPAPLVSADSSGPLTVDTEFSQTVPAAFQVLQDMRKVDQVLQQLRQRQAAVPGSPADTRAELREALREQAHQPSQALGLEVVHLMVENLAGDPRLLPPVQEAIRELEPALLRLALADPRFFSDRAHPARQLLEQVTERSLAWTHPAAPGFDDFIDGLQQAVEVLLETRAAGAEPFEIALTALQDAWSDEPPRRGRSRERAVRALLRAEQRNLLAERIARQLAERPDAANAPPEAVAFLTGPWAQVMAQARLTDTTGAEDPGGHGGMVTLILRSVQHGLASRLAGQQGMLASRLAAGLAAIEHPPTDSDRWLLVLRQLHQLALTYSAEDLPWASEPMELPPRADTWLAPLEAHDAGFVPDQEQHSVWGGAEAESLPAVELQTGAWVDLLGQGWERWQLTWNSPHGLLYMFTHPGGATRSMTRRKLQQMLSEGALRLVSTQAVVDGALDAIAQQAWSNSLYE